MGVAVVLYGFNSCLEHLAGPLPHVFVSVLYPILYFGGFFLYTWQIFDIQSNIVLALCVLQVSLATNDDRRDRPLAFALAYLWLILSANRTANVANVSTGGVDSVPEACTERESEAIGMLLYHTSH
jgi:hypothetical protein